MTNSASLSGFTVSTFLPPSALHKNQSCLILLWSHTPQRIWGCSPDCDRAHNHLTLSGPSPGLLRPHTQPDVPALCLRSPLSFLLPTPISKLMADSWQAEEEKEGGTEERESEKQQKLLCVHAGGCVCSYGVYTVLQTFKTFFLILHRSAELKGPWRSTSPTSSFD